MSVLCLLLYKEQKSTRPSVYKPLKGCELTVIMTTEKPSC